MSSAILEKYFYWIIRVGAYLLPFTLLIIASSMFFPFISGKNFAFRAIVEVMTAFWAGLLIINFKKYWPKWNLLPIAFAVFVAVIFITALFGVNFQMSFWSNYERMDGVITQLHLLALFLVLVGTLKTKREWFLILVVSIFVSVIIAFYGLLEYFGVVAYGQNLHSRIISTLGNPLYVAAYLTFHIFLLFYFITETKSIWLKWMLWAVLLFETAIIFITASRGAFVGIIAGTGIVFLSYLFFGASFKKKVIFASLVIILIATPILLNVFKTADFIKNNGILSRFANISLSAGESRFIIWGIAINAFKENPVLGWGSENFIVPFGKFYDARAFNLEPWYDRAHNMFLEWLVAGGAIGFLAYLFLLGAVFWTILRGVKASSFTKKQAFVFVGMFVAYLIQLLFVFDTLGTNLLFVFTAGFFFAAASYPEEWTNKNHLMPATTGRISGARLGAISVVFAAFALIIIFATIRPFMANRALMHSLTLFRANRLEEALESFNRTFRLSKGTVGGAETAEHLAFNTYNLFGSPAWQTEKAKEIFELAREEMEKLVANTKDDSLNIKYNIILAQLYHQKALVDRDEEALQGAFENYERAMFSAPNYASIYAVYASLLAQSGNIDGAILLTEKGTEVLESADRYDARTFYSPPLYYTAIKEYDKAYIRLFEMAQKYEKQISDGRLNKEMMRDILAIARSHGKEGEEFLQKIYALDGTLR